MRQASYRFLNRATVLAGALDETSEPDLTELLAAAVVLLHEAVSDEQHPVPGFQPSLGDHRLRATKTDRQGRRAEQGGDDAVAA